MANWLVVYLTPEKTAEYRRYNGKERSQVIRITQSMFRRKKWRDKSITEVGANYVRRSPS